MMIHVRIRFGKSSGLIHLIGHFLGFRHGLHGLHQNLSEDGLGLAFKTKRFIRPSGSLKHEGAATLAIPLHLANQIGRISGCEWVQNSPNTLQPSCG